MASEESHKNFNITQGFAFASESWPQIKIPERQLRVRLSIIREMTARETIRSSSKKLLQHLICSVMGRVFAGGLR
jgi:hypothetical protein